MRHAIVITILSLLAGTAQAQNDPLRSTVHNYIRNYQLAGYQPRDAMSLDSVRADDQQHEVRIYANEPFCSQPFTPESVKRIYADIQRRLPAPYNTYHLAIFNKKEIGRAHV